MDSESKISKFDALSVGVEGWFTRLSAVLWDILLIRQANINVRGNLMEIGAWHGKSAAMLAVHTQKNEKLFIFDIETRQELIDNVDKFTKSLNTSVELIKANSFTKITPSFCSDNYKSIRWIHIDGDHSQYGIQNDLEIANTVLHPLGVMVVDDFLNDRFPQISEVTFEFISNHRHDLCLVLSGSNKGYLVRPKFRDSYYSYLSEFLLTEIQKRNLTAKIFIGSNNNYPCLGVRQE